MYTPIGPHGTWLTVAQPVNKFSALFIALGKGKKKSKVTPLQA
jgi:hypothetical protein